MSAASRMKASRHVRMYHMNIKHNKTLYGKILYLKKYSTLYLYNGFCSRCAQPSTKPLVCTDKKYFRIFFVERKSLCLDFNYAQFLQRNRLWIELNLVQQWRRIAFAKNDYCNRMCVLCSITSPLSKKVTKNLHKLVPTIWMVSQNIFLT